MGKGYSIYHKEIHRDGNGGYWVTRESIGVYYVITWYNFLVILSTNI